MGGVGQPRADKMAEINRVFSENPLLWGVNYFPHHFRSASPRFHIDILLAAMRERYFACQCPRESAKAQSLDSKVLTKYGWAKIGQLKEGIPLISPSGGTTRVTHLHQIDKMDLYRITFRGGASTLCNLDHLWRVKCPSNTKQKELVLPLRDIIKNYRKERFDHRFKTKYMECRYYVDLPKLIEFSERNLPIDPYTLGVWLGDGHSANSRYTSDDPEIADYIPYSVKKHEKCINYWIKGLNPILRRMNLIKNKHIPDDYLFGSIKQRTELLQGLIDTDGHIPKKKSAIEFSNKNKRII